MRRLAASLKFTTILAVMACALAATATSAFAVTIEPLNTKFEGKGTSIEWKTSGGVWSCNKSTLTGTTNSTKTNNVNVSPAFSGCEMEVITSKYAVAYANKCKSESTVPWNLALTSGKGPFTGTVKLNCPFTLNVEKGLCIVTVSEQTLENDLTWTTLSGTEPFSSQLAFSIVKAKYTSGKAPSEACSLFGFKETGSDLALSMTVLVNGIKAA
jgi:hypothetical protein